MKNHLSLTFILFILRTFRSAFILAKVKTPCHGLQNILYLSWALPYNAYMGGVPPYLINHVRYPIP